MKRFLVCKADYESSALLCQRSHQSCLICFNVSPICLSRKCGSFGEVWMLMRTKTANSGPPKSRGLGLAEVNSGAFRMPNGLETALKIGSRPHPKTFCHSKDCIKRYSNVCRGCMIFLSSTCPTSSTLLSISHTFDKWFCNRIINVIHLTCSLQISCSSRPAYIRHLYISKDLGESEAGSVWPRPPRNTKINDRRGEREHWITGDRVEWEFVRGINRL